MTGTGHVARTGKMRICLQNMSRKTMNKRHHLRHTDVNERIILKEILKNLSVCWIQMIQNKVQMRSLVKTVRKFWVP
jgi:hypothetical protein